MKTISSELNKEVPIRGRVAFVLALAERTLPALARNVEASKIAKSVLAEGWRWEEGEDIKALVLYEEVGGALAIEGSKISDPLESSAMCAVTSAFYYMIWQAFREDLRNCKVEEGQIPNDMFEVTEAVIDEVCNFTLQTSLSDKREIQVLAERVIREFANVNPDELGAIIPRQAICG